jgi:hypothetical protein
MKTTVRAVSAAALLAASVSVHGAWAAPAVAPEPAKPVDAASFFAGRWY